MHTYLNHTQYRQDGYVLSPAVDRKRHYILQQGYRQGMTPAGYVIYSQHEDDVRILMRHTNAAVAIIKAYYILTLKAHYEI